MRPILCCLACAGAWACASDPTGPGPRNHARVHETGTDDGRLRFGFPVADPTMITTRIGVDHDPIVQTGVLASGLCEDYLGRAFPHCYDQHDGSDFILEGDYATMDAGSIPILAAHDGVVVDAVDGQYDRCHVQGTDVSCDGYPMIANEVTLEHDDGSRTLYWHMKKDSVRVAIGDEVKCGDPLGLIGSSGYSSMPHLHFEFQVADGTVIDPYAGPFSQEESFWEEQNDDPFLPGPGCTAR